MFSDFIKLAREIQGTPIAFPLILAVMWRAYAKEMTVWLVASALATAVIVTFCFKSAPSTFLNLQQGTLDSYLQSIDWAPGLHAEVVSWKLQTKFLSKNAAVFAFTFYVTVLSPKDAKWYWKLGHFMYLLTAITILTYAWWFLLLYTALPSMIPKDDALEKLTRADAIKSFRDGIEYMMNLPLWAAANAMTSWLAFCFAGTYIRRRPHSWNRLLNSPAIDKFMPIIISVIILAFALSGFLFLQPFQAVLWLFFWIVAYPVALSYTRAKPIDGEKLVDIYKAGLTQIPVLGNLITSLQGLISGGAAGEPKEPPPSTPNIDSEVPKKVEPMQ